MRFSRTVATLVCALPFAGFAAETDWAGFYAGGSLGYGWGDAKTTLEAKPPTFGDYGTSLKPKPTGTLFGAQAGYNWRMDRVVAGIEGDASWSGVSDKDKKSSFMFGGLLISNNNPFVSSKQELDWLASVRARVGYLPEDNWLVYATGGPAWGKVSNKAGVGNDLLQFKGSNSAANLGWVAGGGAEWAMSKGYSVKFEYLHYDLGHSSDISSGTPPGAPFQTKFRWDAKGNLLRAGMNFRF